MYDQKLNLIKVNRLLKKKQEELDKIINKKLKFSGKAFVVFKSKEDAEIVFNFEKFIFRKCWRVTKSICNKMDRIYATRADDPNDIVWENMALSDCWRFGRRCCTVIIALAFIVFNFFAVFYINTIKSNAKGRI